VQTAARSGEKRPASHFGHTSEGGAVLCWPLEHGLHFVWCGWLNSPPVQLVHCTSSSPLYFPPGQSAHLSVGGVAPNWPPLHTSQACAAFFAQRPGSHCVQLPEEPLSLKRPTMQSVHLSSGGAEAALPAAHSAHDAFPPVL